MKKIISFILTLLMLIGMLPTAIAAADIPFTDVPASAWYYADVKSAYETGLINGKTATLFMPDDNMTYAEAAKLAACMYQRFTDGVVSLKNGTPDWYSTYVDYAKNRGIITKDYVWNQQATRAGYMEIFAKALPDYALQAINDVPDGSIPDVPMDHPQAEAIYKLYRAGILQGTDAAYHYCNPASTIKRSEVAAIVARMMDSSKRITFSMGTAADPPLTIKTQPDDVAFDPAGDEVSFSVEASGGKAPYTYEWYYKYDSLGWKPIGSDAEGCSESELYLDTDSLYLTGGAQFRCQVTDANGNAVVTPSIKVKVEKELLTVELVSETLSAKDGETVVSSVNVTGGTAPLVKL